MSVTVVVLAAGEGKRMRSALPKVLHPIGGRSLLGHALAAAAGVAPDRVIVVVGHGRDQVRAHLAHVAPDALTVVQEQQNGTGHAVRVALTEAAPDVTGTVLVVCGDVPLLRTETLAELVAAHTGAGAAVTVLTALVPDPSGYGRIVRDDAGALAAIVEQRDATPEQQCVAEINSGVYAFDGAVLRDALGKLSSNNSQGEEYLTDVVGIAREAGGVVGTATTADHHEILGVNDRVQLAELGRVLNDRVLDAHMRSGVSVIDPASTWIDVGVTIEADVTIRQNTQLHGRTTIATGADIGPNSTLTDTVVGAGAAVLACHANEAEIGPGATIGPFTYLRPGTRLGPKTKAGAFVEIGPGATIGPFTYLRPGTRLGGKTKAGAFVEIKNSTIGTGSKVPHLSYVGDGDIGEGSNIGCGTVFVNYDGVDKHRTRIGDHVRVGSDTMLVAPVTLGPGSYTAAGSVIIKDVPPGALAVARAPQRNVENWVIRKRAGSKAAAAAEAAQQDEQE